MHRKCSFLYVRMAQNVRSCLSDGIEKAIEALFERVNY